MYTVLWITGLAVWLLFVISITRMVLNHPKLRLATGGSKWMPYSTFIRYRLDGYISKFLGRGMPREVIDAHLAIRLDEMKILRDVLEEVDKLPTVEKGKQALGLKSIFEVPHRQVNFIKSSYTNVWQNPPYYIPGVPAKTFYDTKEFEWVPPLEAAYPIIREELMNLLERQKVSFNGYMSEGHQRMKGWNTFNFFFYGKKFEENCALCPKTTALLESLPRFERDHVMFSALNPHSAIPPHYGPINGIIRAHLPLIAPPGCYIRVGEDEATWTEGKVLAFDDSFLHQVWNHGDGVRIVLFMNFWHPCFSEKEIPVLERFRRAYELSPLAKVHDRNQAMKVPNDMKL